MKKFYLLSFLLSSMLFLNGCNEYQDQIKNKLKINHIFDRPSTAYGPGSIVLFTKDSGYTNTCFPEWTIKKTTEEIFNNEYKEDNIADLSVKKSTTLEFNLSLDANEKGKVDAKYKDMSKLILSLDGGKQFELKTPIETIYQNAKENPCLSNLKKRSAKNPDGEFYVVLVDYAYNMSYSIEGKNGLRIDGEVPKEVLEVIAAKSGINLESNEEFKLAGKNVFIGFNGDPYSDEETGMGVEMRGAGKGVVPDNMQRYSIVYSIPQKNGEKKVIYLKNITSGVKGLVNENK